MQFLLFLLLGVASATALHEGTPRFMWMAGGDGNLRLVDLEETEDEVPVFNPRSDVSMLLYTKSNTLLPQYIRIESNEIPSSFNPNNPTRFITHGWVSNALTLASIRKAYLEDKSTDYNVIMVDWSVRAASLYPTAKAYTVNVGEYIAQVVNYLRQKTGLSLDNVSLVGHSLGAQISGVAGNRLNGAAGSIVGLDPALPLFLTTISKNKLDSSDAKFVQVIHTCGGLLGFDSALGHVDFYPNNGKSIQPGCGLDTGGVCSHMRAFEFFAESITTTKGFVARKCSSWTSYNLGLCKNNQAALMGEKVDKSASGDYFLSTSRRSPFAQG